ncbi:hypothetical protein IMSAGC011_00982 [Lachnospiraceae bacterium]|nr:hypothetical protein IMSAGC011_00982 [Lachnospiraceae bacterium]
MDVLRIKELVRDTGNLYNLYAGAITGLQHMGISTNNLDAIYVECRNFVFSVWKKQCKIFMIVGLNKEKIKFSSYL